MTYSSRLTSTQCAQLHAASLRILERTGVRLHEPEAIQLARKGGCEVFDGNRVRFPAKLVEWALSTAPKPVTLYNRRGEPAMRLEGHTSYFGPGSDCLWIVDHCTGERRRPVLDDVAKGVTVADALPNIDFVMSMFLPADVDQALADRYQMEVLLNRTTKPIVFVTYELSGCADAVAMAEAGAGGAEALRQKPNIACYINVTTGLVHNEEALQKLLYLAGKGLPALYIPVVSGGTTGPVTMAGGLAVMNAGTLAGVALAQLKREGAPIVIPGMGGDALDMRTTVDPYCGPDHLGMPQSLAHYYNLPMFSLAGASDAKLPDGQAAAEAAMLIVLAAFAGGHIVHDLGYLESGLSGSLAQLVICDEIVFYVRAMQQPVEIDDETLALDLIDELGPAGSFLETEHTLRHFRQRWYPTVFERFNYDGWVEAGGKTLVQRAADRVEEILAAHRPAPLPRAAAERIHAIVKRAEQN